MALTPEQRAELYNKLKASRTFDDSELEEAKKDYKVTNIASNIGELFGDLANVKNVSYGGAPQDTSYYDRLRNQAKDKISLAEQNRQRQMQNAMLEEDIQDKIQAADDRATKLERDNLAYQRQDTSYQRQEKEYEDAQSLKERENDVNSEESKVYQNLAKKLMPSKDFSNINAAQLKRALPVLQKQYEIEMSSKARIAQQTNRANELEERRREREYNRDLIRYDKLKKEAKLNPSQVSNIADKDATIAKTNQIIRDLGENEGWVGPLDGRIPDAVVSEEQVAFRAQVGRLNDAYRKAITGAGASVQEIARLETRLPQVTDTYKNFVAKARGLQEELKRIRENEINALDKSGKNVEEFKSKPTSSAPLDLSGVNKVIGKNKYRSAVKRQYSPSENKTYITYDNGDIEVIDGK